MKKILLFTLSLFVSFASFSQTKDVVGFWEILGHEVDVITNDTEFTEELENQFKKKVKLDEQGRLSITQFSPDGKVYERIDDSGTEYRIFGDSIHVGDVLGVFDIEDGIFTITCNIRDEIVQMTEQRRNYMLEEEGVSESDVPLVQIDRVEIIIRLRKTDRTFDK